MIFIQFIAAFIAVVSFSVNLEIPKKHIMTVGLVGALGWVIFVICNYFNLNEILAYFISALFVTIISLVLSKLLNAVSTIFLIPGILPIVPGIAMYKMIYFFINNNLKEAAYQLLQAILITGGIALAIFITESIKGIKIIRKEQINEN